jgi:hypothetical protein
MFRWYTTVEVEWWIPLMRVRVWSLLGLVEEFIGWLTWDRAGPFSAKRRTVGWEGWGVWCGKLIPHGCSLRLCQLRTDRLTIVSKYWTYWSHAGEMSPVNWCSCVANWPKLFSATPRLTRGRKNEVPPDDSGAGRSLGAKTSSECKGHFDLVGTMRKVATYEDHPQEA